MIDPPKRPEGLRDKAPNPNHKSPRPRKNLRKIQPRNSPRRDRSRRSGRAGRRRRGSPRGGGIRRRGGGGAPEAAPASRAVCRSRAGLSLSLVGRWEGGWGEGGRDYLWVWIRGDCHGGAGVKSVMRSCTHCFFPFLWEEGAVGLVLVLIFFLFFSRPHFLRWRVEYVARPRFVLFVIFYA